MMIQEEVIKQTDFPAGYGFIFCSVCVPKKATPKQIEKAVNMLNPTGIKSPWSISKDETFSGGEPNPCQCQEDKNKLHYLLNC